MMIKENDKSKAFFPYSKSSNYFMDSTDTHTMNKWSHSQINHSDFWALIHTCSILSIRRRRCPKGDYQLSQLPPLLVSLDWDLSIMEYATGALLFRKELPIELQFLGRPRSRLFFVVWSMRWIYSLSIPILSSCCCITAFLQSVVDPTSLIFVSYICELRWQICFRISSIVHSLWCVQITLSVCATECTWVALCNDDWIWKSDLMI